MIISLARKKRKRRATSYAAFAVLLTGLFVAPASPAAAAFSSPTAVGVGADGDARVWEAVATTAGSLVRARTYRAGLPGAAVDAQRWQWERVTFSATAGITFRIRNVASARCLDRTTAGVVISDCGTATSQRWRAPLSDPYGGWTLINVGNSQCLASRDDPNPGALIQTAACNGGALQRWRLRPAPQDCTVRSRDWVQTEVCASQGAERMSGVMVNWNHYPYTMTWVDPEDYILSNTVKNYTQIRPLKADGSQGQTGVDVGLRADRSTQSSGAVSYSAYWLEWNAATEQYHALNATQAPGSNTANERNHTFMLLGNGNAGQWDLLYDYNTVAATALQAGGTTRHSRAGIAARYAHAVTASEPFGFRMQLLDGNGAWRLPYLNETGLGEPKKCDTPPRYEDWVYDVVNLPPNCFTSSYKAIPGVEDADPPRLEAFGVGKPGTSAAVSSRDRTPGPSTATGVHNGVDQRSLAACLQDEASTCLNRVPGLAACVAARLQCNTTAATTRATLSVAPQTADQALEQAQRTFSTVERNAKVQVATMQSSAAKHLGNVDASGPVHVVTSSAEVRSMAASNNNTYNGYTAIFDATSRGLLYACLGAACQRE